MGHLWRQEECGIALITLKATVQLVSALPFIKCSLERLVNTSVYVSRTLGIEVFSLGTGFKNKQPSSVPLML